MKNKISKKDLSYIAGIIDGEGCIKIYKVNAEKINRPNNRYCLNIQVSMTTKVIVKFLYDLFGGYLYLDKINTYKHPNWKDRQRWIIQNQKCKEFLYLILPYLKLKNKQAKLALKFLDIKPGHIKAKHKIWYKMKKLNKIGRH